MDDVLNSPVSSNTIAVNSTNTNTLTEIQARIQAEKIGWTWPLVLAFIRFPLTLLGAVLTYVFFTLQKNPYAFQLSFITSGFYFTFVNLICLGLLFYVTRREGMRVRALIGFQREKIGKDILLGFLWCIVLYVPFSLCIMLVPLIIYGGVDAFKHFAEIFSSGNVAISLPLWLGLWQAFVFPTLNAPIEEMFYRGYTQPRLIALTKHTWIGIAITTLGFALQHTVFAPTLLGSFIFILCFFVWGAGAALIYQKQQRLPALIIAHFITNFATGAPVLIAFFIH